MANYVLAFRGPDDRTASADEEAAWGQWFGEIGTSIVDPGNRVARTATLGRTGTGKDVLTGYTVITAPDFDAAVAIAERCPGLSHNGGVEVAETVAMG